MTNRENTTPIEIDDAAIEQVLDEHEVWRMSTLNDYFSAAASDQPTEQTRDIALILMRRAWLGALTRPRIGRRLDASSARGYVMTAESIVRQTMNLDGLPVPRLWNVIRRAPPGTPWPDTGWTR
jgi:hypothetical protein